MTKTKRINSILNTSLLLFLLLFAILGCQEKKEIITIPLNEDYKWEIEVSNKWSEFSNAKKESITNRGNKLIEDQDHIESSGFTDLIMIEKGKSQFIAGLGKLDEAKYGNYEEQRELRANYYQEIFQNKLPDEEIKMEVAQIHLEDISLKRFMIQFKLKDIPIVDIKLRMTIYEGKISEEEFITISCNTWSEEDDLQMQAMVLNSKFLKL